MRETIDRRRFVGLLGAAGIVGAAGCSGTGGGRSTESGTENDGTDDGDDATDQPAETPEFDFPPGADDGGIVSDRILSGVRDILATTDRYRISQAYRLDYGNGTVATAETTVDVDGDTVLERRTHGDTEIQRFVTPEHARCRASQIDGDRTGQWVTASVDPTAVDARSFHLVPFEQTTASTLLGSASLGFDGIVTEGDQSYARYTGSAIQREWPRRQWWDSARLAHDLESPLEGTVSLQLAESGAVRAVEYDLTGSVARETREGRDVTDTTARGEIRFEYGGSEEVATPDWADSGRFRAFAVTDHSTGPVYEMTQGPALPGSRNLAYAEFHVAAHLDGEQYFAQFSKTQDFEVGDRLFMGIGRDGLELSRFSVSGRNPLAAGDWLEVSVYLFHPEKGRSLIYHDEFQP